MRFREICIIALLVGLTAYLWVRSQSHRRTDPVVTKHVRVNRPSDDPPRASANSNRSQAITPHYDPGTTDWRTDFGTMLVRSLQDSLNWIEYSCDSARQPEAMELFIDYWMKHGPEAAIRASVQIENKVKRHRYIEALASYADLSFEESVRLTESVAAGDEMIFRTWTQAVASRWQESDLPRVLQWAENSEPAVKKEILIKALPFWAKTDPVSASQQYDANSGLLPSDTRRRIGAEWASNDGEAALRWLSNIADPLQREIAVRNALEAYAQTNPEKAIEYALKLPLPKDQMEASVDIAGAMAKTDPKAAAAWVGKFPEGLAFDKGVLAVFREYSKQDLKATGDWLSTLPKGSTRDKVFGEYVQDLQRHFPSTAVEWALLIENEGERNRRLKNALEDWSRSDPQAAEGWSKRHAQSAVH